MLGSLRLHVFGRLVRDVEKRAAVRSAAPFLHFGVDRARHHVARRKLHALRVVLLHEALAVLVAQDAAFAAHRFGDQNSLHSRRPDHPRGMKLHEFHVQQLGACFVGQRHSVARAFPGIRRDLPGFPDAAGGDHDRLRLEHDETPGLAPVSERARDAVAVFQQLRDRAFHENVEAHLHAAVLQRADHLQARAVADVAQPLERVAAERALQNVAVLGAVEKRAPLLELAHAVRSFLRVKLRHAPVVQRAFRRASCRGNACASRRPCPRCHRRGESALGHHRVRLAQQRFAYHAHFRALRQRLDRSPEARAARADDQHVVFVGFVFGVRGHSSRMSFIAPLATSRMYRSVRPTEIMLTHAQNMWCSFSFVTPCHAVWRGPPATEQEKQSSLPPTRWRSEWQENVYVVSRTMFTSITSVPTPIPNLPSKSKCHDRVVPEEHDEYHRDVEEIAVHILQDERKRRLAAILAAAALADRARRRVQQECRGNIALR